MHQYCKGIRPLLAVGFPYKPMTNSSFLAELMLAVSFIMNINRWLSPLFIGRNVAFDSIDWCC